MAYFFSELVTRVNTSWFSSRSRLVARCPNRLSAKRGDANSLMHSICPKCVRSPSVKRYSSFATLLRLAKDLVSYACSPLLCMTAIPSTVPNVVIV